MSLGFWTSNFDERFGHLGSILQKCAQEKNDFFESWYKFAESIIKFDILKTNFWILNIKVHSSQESILKV